MARGALHMSAPRSACRPFSRAPTSRGMQDPDPKRDDQRRMHVRNDGGGSRGLPPAPGFRISSIPTPSCSTTRWWKPWARSSMWKRASRAGRVVLETGSRRSARTGRCRKVTFSRNRPPDPPTSGQLEGDGMGAARRPGRGRSGSARAWAGWLGRASGRPGGGGQAKRARRGREGLSIGRSRSAATLTDGGQAPN